MSRTAPPPGLDVYLFPAVVGGGVGDIEEVLLAGRRLHAGGFRPILYRAAGRALPRSVAGPWGWPPHRRSTEISPRADRAMTLSAWWGVSAAPTVDAPYGRGGVWEEESREVERVYGPEKVLHVSFEEFARTLGSRAQTAERWREGGVPVREIRRRLAEPSSGREVSEFHDAFARFRGFDRPNVLHLYPTFDYSPSFHREFPSAVQTGPFWPERLARPALRPGRWVWYASPGSSPRLAAAIARGWEPELPPVTIELRATGVWPLPRAAGLRWRRLPPLSPRAWRGRFSSAELRIVTGSRTLLEALSDGRPFLYFNGVSGSGRSTRRHRPEKVEALLRHWRRTGGHAAWCRDLSEFSRLRAVGEVLGRFRRSRGRGFPSFGRPRGFRPPFDDCGGLIVECARALASGDAAPGALVSALRSGHLPTASPRERRHP